MIRIPEFTLCAVAVFCFLYYLSSNDAGPHTIRKVSVARVPPPAPLKLKSHDFAPEELCPLTAEDLQGANGIAHSRIAIVLAILHPQDYADYAPAIDSLQCYAHVFGYRMQLINMSEDQVALSCNQTDVFFKRHCAVVNWMAKVEEEVDYILYLDADMGVVNPCHLIQEYIESDKPVEIKFYERYYDQEIAAGSYLARNSKYSRAFLRYWADYFYRLPESFHGTDNGALHQVFMEQHFAKPEEGNRCFALWNGSRGFDDLFQFQACTKLALGPGNSYFCEDRVRLVRKLEWGWVRDGWLTDTRWAPLDFLLHGWKLSKLGAEWEWPFRPPKFDPRKCSVQDMWSNFDYVSALRTGDSDILESLRRITEDVNHKYEDLLMRAGFTCPNGTASITKCQ